MKQWQPARETAPAAPCSCLGALDAYPTQAPLAAGLPPLTASSGSEVEK